MRILQFAKRILALDFQLRKTVFYLLFFISNVIGLPNERNVMSEHLINNRLNKSDAGEALILILHRCREGTVRESNQKEN